MSRMEKATHRVLDDLAKLADWLVEWPWTCVEKLQAWAPRRRR